MNADTADARDALDQLTALAPDVPPAAAGGIITDLAAALSAVLDLADEWDRDGRPGPVRVASTVRAVVLARLLDDSPPHGEGPR